MNAIHQLFEKYGVSWRERSTKVKATSKVDYLRKISWDRIGGILRNENLNEEKKKEMIKRTIAYDLFSLKGYLVLEKPTLFFEETGGLKSFPKLQMKMLELPLFILKNADELSPTVSSKMKMMKCDVAGWEEDREYLKVFFPEFELMRVFDKQRAEEELKKKLSESTYEYLIGTEFKERTSQFIELLAKEIINEKKNKKIKRVI